MYPTGLKPGMPAPRSADPSNQHTKPHATFQSGTSPLIKTLPAKGISATELFLKMDSVGNALLLEAAMPGLQGSKSGWFEGRYSLLAGSPFGIFKSKGRQSQFDYSGGGDSRCFVSQSDPLAALQEWIDRFKITKPPRNDTDDLPFLQGGLAGFFSYELVHHFENIPLAAEQKKKLNDIHLLFLNFFVLLDHHKDLLHIVYVPAPELRMGRDLKSVHSEGWQKVQTLADRLLQSKPVLTNRKPFRPQQTEGTFDASSACSPAQYMNMVLRAKSYIAAGDIFQANLSHCFTSTYSAQSLLPFYQRLTAINPSPFSAYLDFGAMKIASVSPERLVRIKKNPTGDSVETKPIAGTKPRGSDALADQHLVESLYQSDKEQSEHLMLIDLARNDLGKICAYGTVKVDEMMALEQYSHVSHLVSNITGILKANTSPLQVLKALFPGGTITGVPKIRCMSIISELENRARGIYTGAIGYIGFDGEMDLNIAIRTAVLENDCLSYQVGAGIVADSDPASEYEETLHKAAVFFKALKDEQH